MVALCKNVITWTWASTKSFWAWKAYGEFLLFASPPPEYLTQLTVPFQCFFFFFKAKRKEQVKGNNSRKTTSISGDSSSLFFLGRYYVGLFYNMNLTAWRGIQEIGKTRPWATLYGWASDGVLCPVRSRMGVICRRAKHLERIWGNYGMSDCNRS